MSNTTVDEKPKEVASSGDTISISESLIIVQDLHNVSNVLQSYYNKKRDHVSKKKIKVKIL